MNSFDRIKSHGFTIVELLVVIVVIGILAGITIVSYAGVQNRAKTTSNLTNAQEVQNKAEIYASDTGNGVYPTSNTTFKALASTDNAALSATVKALLGTTVPSASSPTVLIYYQCGTNGGKVGYWDYTTSSITYLYIGAAISSTACSAAA